MTERSPCLDMPFLQPSQAQKHVTHNEALEILDAVVQLSVQGFDAVVPPGAPNPGDRYALGAGAIGAWAGQPAGTIARWEEPAWLFFSPQDGWIAWGQGEGEQRVFQAGSWAVAQPAELGVNTTPDATNRLAVASDATLFTHDGADHRLKVNKATDTDTASLVFQSNWTGHAEMGLTGGTDWSVKVSADGSTWSDAMTIETASGHVGIGTDTPGETLHVHTASNSLQGMVVTNLATGQGIADGLFLGVGGTASPDARLTMRDAVNMRLGTNGADKLVLESSGAIRPALDNAQDLGTATCRLDNIYAANAVIQTSDAAQKTDIEVLSDAEARVAQAARGLLRKYRFRTSVENKGAAARVHFGIIAQDLVAAFEAEDLDPWRYAVLCKDCWWERPASEPGDETTEVFDEDPGGATYVERLGVRYPELLAFVLAV